MEPFSLDLVLWNFFISAGSMTTVVTAGTKSSTFMIKLPSTNTSIFLKSTSPHNEVGSFQNFLACSLLKKIDWGRKIATTLDCCLGTIVFAIYALSLRRFIWLMV